MVKSSKLCAKPTKCNQYLVSDITTASVDNISMPSYLCVNAMLTYVQDYDVNVLLDYLGY